MVTAALWLALLLRLTCLTDEHVRGLAAFPMGGRDEETGGPATGAFAGRAFHPCPGTTPGSGETLDGATAAARGCVHGGGV